MSEIETNPVIARLMRADCDWKADRDKAGNTHCTLRTKKQSVTIVAPTFDEAVTRALDMFEMKP